LKVTIVLWVLLFSVLSTINGVGAMLCGNKIDEYHFQEMSAIYLVGLGVIYTIKCIMDERR